jgi:hypothetical protein
MVVLLSKANYSSKEAIKNGDVVLTHNDSYNIDNFFDFLEKKRNSLRVVVYTDEGDPIITDLTYDQGDNILFKIDNSKDRFSGSGGSKTGVCNNIIQQTNLNGVRYNLTGCSGFEDSIFLFLLENEEQ